MESSILSFLLSSTIHMQVGLRLLIASVELIILAIFLEAGIRFIPIRSPRLRCWLWGMVLMKPLLTLIVGTPLVLARFEILPEISPRITAKRSEVPQNLDFAHEDVSSHRFEENLDPSLAGVEVEPSERRGPVAWYSIPLRPETLLTSLTCLWIMGICVGGIRWFLAGYRLGCIMARTEPPEEHLEALYKETASRLGVLPAPDLRISAEIESPVIFGAINPVVILPSWLLESEESRLVWLFKHELNHRKNHDAWWLAVCQLSQVLFFFHPVSHWAYREWLLNVELACDRCVIDNERDAKVYAEELFAVLEGMHHRQAALSGLYATQHQIGARVEALLDHPTEAAPYLNLGGKTVVSIFAVCLVLFGFGIDTRGRVAGGDDTLFFGSAAPEAPEEAWETGDDGVVFGDSSGKVSGRHP